MITVFLLPFASKALRRTKASLLKVYSDKVSMRRLIVPQCHHGIDVGRARAGMNHATNATESRTAVTAISVSGSPG